MSDTLGVLLTNLRGKGNGFPGDYVKEAVGAIEALRAHAEAVEGTNDNLVVQLRNLRAELNEAADATGIAGVDKPMSLLECIQSLRAEVERLTDTKEECEECGGSGRSFDHYDGGKVILESSCPSCGGHGWKVTTGADLMASGDWVDDNE